MVDLSLCRSLLFLPASNARAIAKARDLPADLIILDLEDAVRAEDKANAREAALAAAGNGFGGRPVAIRINPESSPEHGADMLAARRADIAFVILPKVESAKAIHDVHAVSERPVVAMIESAVGVLEAREIARNAVGLIAGTNDLAASLRLPADAGRAGLSTALQQILLCARAAGIPAFDGVCNTLADDDTLRRETEEGRAFGFDGKAVIHPSQIDTVNRIFAPSADALAQAQALVAAATGGAERYQGRMIEAMHVDAARRLIARAGR